MRIYLPRKNKHENKNFKKNSASIPHPNKFGRPLDLKILWDKYKDSVTEFKDGNIELYTDYVEGRMMKTIFSVDNSGLLTINDNREPRSDYQSWCKLYPTNRELVNAVKLYIHFNH